MLEASDGPGGRVRTDRVNGFLIDRGFQVLFTAYPEVARQIDLAALGPSAFVPGAEVRFGGRSHRIADPLRAPRDLLRTLASPIGSPLDKARVLLLRQRALWGTLDDLFARADVSTLDALKGLGFSDTIVDRFFRPFLGGIFLGRDLSTSSRMLEFVFRMLSLGDTVLLRDGMGSLSAQLAGRLPAGALRLGARVTSLEDGAVRLERGERVPASAVVVATEGDTAAQLTGAFPAPRFLGVTTLSFAADRSPLPARTLVLNAEDGPLNTVCTLSDVCPSYAPAGQALIAATVLGIPVEDDAALARTVLASLDRWYGGSVRSWQLLRVDRVARAQPAQPARGSAPATQPVRLGPKLFVAGDHRDNASIHGALASGRRAAHAVLAESSARVPAKGAFVG